MNRAYFGTAILLATGWTAAEAAEVRLTPGKDNTLFADGNLSNGAGQYLFAGATAPRNSSRPRRALLWFDIAQDVPAGATITDATLTLNMNRTISGGSDASLHRLLQDWGEGGSNASGEEGQGASAQQGDATWNHTFFPTSEWTSPGGDFVETASDTTSVGSLGKYTWGGTSGALVADVQLWLDDPAQNFGWILIGNESVSASAKRFDSREALNEANRPTLNLSFDVGLTGDCNGDGVVDINDVVCSCTSPDFELPDVLAAANLIQGDLDGDGSVAFPDFLALSANFGQDGTYTSGDLDCDGTVAFADFLVLSANFGKSSAAVPASVPEPSSYVGLLIGLFALANRDWHRT